MPTSSLNVPTTVPALKMFLECNTYTQSHEQCAWGKIKKEKTFQEQENYRKADNLVEKHRWSHVKVKHEILQMSEEQ